MKNLNKDEIFLCGDGTYLKKDDEVEFSSLGLATIRTRQRSGIVIRASKDKSCLFVTWVGTKKKTSYHRNFLRKKNNE